MIKQMFFYKPAYIHSLCIFYTVGYTKAGYDRYGFNVRGYDRSGCNLFYKGPFSPRQSRQVWQILLRQPKAFLMSLARTCPGLEPLPVNWLQQYWISDIKDVTGRGGSWLNEDIVKL